MKKLNIKWTLYQSMKSNYLSSNLYGIAFDKVLHIRYELDRNINSLRIFRLPLNKFL